MTQAMYMCTMNVRTCLFEAPFDNLCTMNVRTCLFEAPFDNLYVHVFIGRSLFKSFTSKMMYV
jgi:hypothetical protein